MTEKDQVPDELVSQVGPAAWVPAWVLKVGLTDGELRIYVALRTFADRDGKAHPRPETVAQRASNAAGRPISVRSVHNAYGRFRQLGLIKTTRIRREDGTHGPVRVTLRDVPVRTTALPSAVAEPPHHAGENHRTTQGKTTAPRSAVKEHPITTPPKEEHEPPLTPRSAGGAICPNNHRRPTRGCCTDRDLRRRATEAAAAAQRELAAARRAVPWCGRCDGPDTRVVLETGPGWGTPAQPCPTCNPEARTA